VNRFLLAASGSRVLRTGRKQPTIGLSSFGPLWQKRVEMANPAFVPPMLAKLVKALPEGPEWEYELKLDGYRLEAIKDGDKVRPYSRRGNDFTKKFARIATSVSKIKETSFVLDGEAVVVDSQGKPSFQMLQNALPYHAVGPWLITPLTCCI
jgi:bifunctional non-homologous end joining protein LigD